MSDDGAMPAQHFVKLLFATYPAATAQLLASEDKAFFLAISQRPGQKPVPFIPVLEVSFERRRAGIRGISWAAEDIEAAFDENPQPTRSAASFDFYCAARFSRTLAFPRTLAACPRILTLSSHPREVARRAQCSRAVSCGIEPACSGLGHCSALPGASDDPALQLTLANALRAPATRLPEVTPPSRRSQNAPGCPRSSFALRYCARLRRRDCLVDRVRTRSTSTSCNRVTTRTRLGLAFPPRFGGGWCCAAPPYCAPRVRPRITTPIGLAQLTQYLITRRVARIDPGEMREKLQDATGHSQGAVSAAAVAASRSLES
ncbi:uncharacterized protein B0H18DRAFT_1113843 [Fomitopsis serialis]|uniref:uncharacterized protein n=1 Tax=Fomitopsis serialis TaxID=139415 RepID=UPI00200860B9|nr:uncharacterized protein B0H18DRAFT_1113843 [Neoantrodia serialis]KAH9936459.1 hypothetical protein B0H18DRAFT_1113843 [Neoantrodia serialis]